MPELRRNDGRHRRGSFPAAPKRLSRGCGRGRRRARARFSLQCQGGRRQPARRAAAPGALSARRPARPTSSGSKSPARFVALGRNASRFAIGDSVLALVPGGGYAQYCAAHESNALPIPSGVSMIEAGAIPETFFTVWTNVFDRGGLKSGRNAARAWRHVRHRHDCDHARQSLRREGDRNSRLG